MSKKDQTEGWVDVIRPLSRRSPTRTAAKAAVAKETITIDKDVFVRMVSALDMATAIAKNPYEVPFTMETLGEKAEAVLKEIGDVKI